MLLLSVGFVLATMPTGCDHVQPATEASEVDSDPTEPKGPGILTGRDGAWTVYRSGR